MKSVMILMAFLLMGCSSVYRETLTYKLWNDQSNDNRKKVISIVGLNMEQVERIHQSNIGSEIIRDSAGNCLYLQTNDNSVRIPADFGFKALATPVTLSVDGVIISSICIVAVIIQDPPIFPISH